MPEARLAWDDFRLVKSVADAKGLSGAAQRLGVNHSTVFRRLGQLEAQLGVKLFERHRTGYALTAAGEEMAALAERMDDGVARFTRRLAGQAISPAGELRVTTNDTLLVHLMTPIFARFCARCPEVRLDVVLTNQALNLSKRDADVAIRATDNPPENLVGRRAATVGWAIYGRGEDFAEPANVDPERLADRPWVALGDNLATLNAARFVRERVPAEKMSTRSTRCSGSPKRLRPASGSAPCPASLRIPAPRSCGSQRRSRNSRPGCGC
jgi:DNA-binding transcriptional LysR family regulator